MGALPRPDIPPGAGRDLNAALHELHHHVGWPSLRFIARRAGCSHTTVSKVFSSPQLPAWGVLEVVVEALGGDSEKFRRLWLAASSLDPPIAGRKGPEGIAGRRAELLAVRRHLEAGAGLVLVTGEAGIGKTKLVAAARSMGNVFVAQGHCLPLSTGVSLHPVAAALREIWELDEGAWLNEVLTSGPSYVRRALVPLLPELGPVDVSPDVTGEWARHRLFGAVGTVLIKLAASQPLALSIEDLHWSDGGTLELLEHLVARRVPLPMLGTFRLDDPETSDRALEWFERVRRLSQVATIDLGPLTWVETGEQLALLTGEALNDEDVGRIHRRSAGHPLFTEQLAAQVDDSAAFPRLLADLLDRRLDRLDGTLGTVLRALGVAEKPLSDQVLRQVTGLDAGALTACLRELDHRRLLGSSPGGHEVQLRHPLLAEAVRRSQVPGEASDTHRRLARALAGLPTSSAAEIAAHWQAAGDREEELSWQVRAAEEAASCFDAAQEAEHWLRVVELSRPHTGTMTTIGARARLSGTDSLKASFQFDRAWALSEENMNRLADFHRFEQAEVLQRAADFRSDRAGDAAMGLELVDRAIRLYSKSTTPSAGYVEALERKVVLLKDRGQYARAAHELRIATKAAKDSGDSAVQRRLLGRRAWLQALSGSVSAAKATIAEATEMAATVNDPLGDLWLADVHTAILLRDGAPYDNVAAAGRPCLEEGNVTGIENFSVLAVRWRVAESLLRDGRVEEAAQLIHSATSRRVVRDDRWNRWPLYVARARLCVARGDFISAASYTGPLEQRERNIEIGETLATSAAEVDLWSGQPRLALDQLLPFLKTAAETEASTLLGHAFVLSARAVADAGGNEHERERLAEVLISLHNSAHTDPFDSQLWTQSRAQRATWAAELTRSVGSSTVEAWAAAAKAWDQLLRPFDAAYCRWRGALVALAMGQGTTAQRLLHRAARDARGHQPLTEGIQASQCTPTHGGQRP